MSEKNNPVEQINEFFANLKKYRDQLSIEDMNVAIESLQIALKDLDMKKLEAEQKQREERKRQREEERQRRHREHIEKVTSMDLPMDWNNVFNSDSRTQGVHTDSISDALIMCLSTLGKVDIEYISSITGVDYKTVITALKGSIYQNPLKWNEVFYKGWETADEYLSGNLIQKYKAAKLANEKYNGYFEDNIKAIEAVLPPTVPTEDIYITLGSPWVPTDIIDEFIEHLFGGFPRMWANTQSSRDYLAVKHDEFTGSWEIPDKARYFHSVTDTKTYGTMRIEALHILEKTLNMKTINVTDEVNCPSNASGKKRVVNKIETLLAIDKQQKMIKEFQDWVWKDEKRKERLETIFDEKYGCVRRRMFDGSFLTFPTMSPAVRLYDYQKNAVARILFTPNTLLAHDVGSGKTYVMIAAGMEMRRMGLSDKNLYVVPNNIIGQWKDIFLEMYPDAKLLIAEPRVFTPDKREHVLERIRDEDFDGIIMAYSCFEQIPLSRRYYTDELEAKKEQINEIIRQRNKSTAKLRKKQDAVLEALSKLTLALDDTANGIYYDDLGITRLFIDEAHNFKNVPIDTKITKVLGINTKGSKKCQDMMDKVHLTQKMNSGGGVVMATGTPITNSVTDAFVIQQYLQSGELALLDLQNFDSWIGMFAESKSEFEIDVDTNSYRLATRFSKFHNLPELTAMLSSIADFHRADAEAGLPEFDGYSDALIGKTADFEHYLQNISQRAENVRMGIVSRNADNMLKITTDGRKAALDLRLVDPNALYTPQSKVARCAENVLFIYNHTFFSKSTQLIFCDTSTPKDSFNMYDELKDILVGYGIPENEIAFIHDADTETKRERLFREMREGKIRVLIGSTFKLGLGVNVQDRLLAVHHLDIPWRPADMVQREGRILRQGNMNEKVSIYRYITEGSFDAYSWQLLETKQRFISELLSGSLTQRSGADVDDTVLNYAEIKALAIGNPLVKKRVGTANELTRYTTLQRKNVETRLALEKELLEIPGKIEYQKKLIEKAQSDMEHYNKALSELPVAVTTAEKNAQAEKRKQLRMFVSDAVKKNVLMHAEKLLTEYLGFRIILPANMTAEKPFVYLERDGRYYVELGDTEVGTLIRIDNFLSSLESYKNKQNEKLFDLHIRQKEIQNELNKKESYTDKIEALKQELKSIDLELGVEKQ